ncbi:O-antigen ligase family protein [Dyadobacter fermentans]|uniref:O-antigen ligase family protein n=1 Tax=Dyadobacter fermentans TaxID=94254 RepID=UPI00019B5C5E|nr:O-antigen ligase family protein [Dyadobacter fermentans]
MTLYYIAFVLLLGSSFWNFKKTVLAWAALSILFHDAVCLKFSSPALTIVFSANAFFFAMFFIKYKRSPVNDPFFNATVTLFFSYLISTFIPENVFSTTILKTVQSTLNNLVIVHIIGACINDIKDLRFTLKVQSFVIIASLLYGIITFLTQSNPVIDFELAQIPTTLETAKLWSYVESSRGIRVQSFFMNPFIFGVYIISFLFLQLIIQSRFPLLIKQNKSYLLILIGLVTVGVFITKSRSVIIPYCLLSPLLLRTTLKRQIGFVALLLLCVVISIPFLDDSVLEMVSSAFDSSSKNVGGSSISMRQHQFAIVLGAFSKAPIFGNGLGYINALKASNFELYGAESVWMPLLANGGVVGVVLYIVFFYLLIKPKIFRGIRFEAALIVGAYLLIVTMNGDVNVGLYYTYLTVVLLYKIKLLYPKLEYGYKQPKTNFRYSSHI